MDPPCASCNASFCLVHPSIPTEDEISPMNLDGPGGTSCTNSEVEVNDLAATFESLTTIGPGESLVDIQATTTPVESEQFLAVLNPHNLALDKSTFRAPDGNLPRSSHDRFGFGFLDEMIPVQPIIDIQDPNPASPSSSPSSSHEPPMNQLIGTSEAVRPGTKDRRKRRAVCICPVCNADLANSLKYHFNKHHYIQSYNCEHKDRGCDYSTTAPNSAKRHSRFCEYKSDDM